MWGKLAGGLGGGTGEFGEGPREVRPGIDVEKGAGAENRVDDGGAPAGIWMADEKEIFLVMLSSA